MVAPAACDFCKAGPSSVIRATDLEMSATRWLQPCGVLGMPCLVNITRHSAWLAWSDVEQAAHRLLPSEVGNQSGAVLRFESLRAHGKEAEANAFEEAARRDPETFLRAFSGRAGIEMGCDRVRVANASASVADWYVSWYDIDPPTEQRRRLRKRIGDQRVPFLPPWRRGDRWFFLSWVASESELPGRKRHKDRIMGASITAHFQLHGRKLWRLSPPEECSRECGDETFEVIAQPGQLFSLDTNRWYHQTAMLPPAPASSESPLSLSVARHLYAEDSQSDGPLFAALDVDRNGFISPRELFDSLMSLQQARGPHSAEVLWKAFEPSMSRMVRDVDMDGDGQLDAEEYMALVSRRQKNDEEGDEGDDEGDDGGDDDGGCGAGESTDGGDVVDAGSAATCGG